MTSTERQENPDSAASDSTWSSAPKLSRKVRELAHRSFHALKSGPKPDDQIPARFEGSPGRPARPACSGSPPAAQDPRPQLGGPDPLDRRTQAAGRRPAPRRSGGRLRATRNLPGRPGLFVGQAFQPDSPECQVGKPDLRHRSTMQSGAAETAEHQSPTKTFIQQEYRDFSGMRGSPMVILRSRHTSRARRHSRVKGGHSLMSIADTRGSVIFGVCQHDPERWREFDAIYRPMLFAFLRKQGLHGVRRQ